MDTKLKNLTKKQAEMLLAAAGILLCEILTFLGICESYRKFGYIWPGRQFHVQSVRVLTVCFVLIGAAVIVLALWYLWKWKPWRNLSPCRADQLTSELVIILIFLGLHVWKGYFAPDGKELTVLFPSVRVAMNSVTMMIVIFFLTLFCSVSVFGGLLLLIRQMCLGIFRETCWTIKKIRHYKTVTPLEVQARHVRIPWLFVALLINIGFLWMIYFGLYDRAMLAMMQEISFFLFLYLCLGDQLTQQTGLLLKQIQAMKDGNPTPKEDLLPPGSLLYEASCQLQQIDEAMHESMEKRLQAERLKIDLITNVSHDLKTPLTSMVGYTDLLKKEDLSAEARDYVDVISMKQEQLKSMIQDLFELSKATSGAEQLVLETLDMRRLTEQTLGDMEDAIKESGLTIRTRFSEEPLPFKGDNAKMYRVVQNLLENVLKYSLQNTRVYIETRKQDGQIELEIKNIASYEMNFTPEEMKERFTRGDDSRSTEGHGLGLAIASSFVQNMNGSLDIAVDGDLFKVTVKFPAVPAAELDVMSNPLAQSGNQESDLV